MLVSCQLLGQKVNSGPGCWLLENPQKATPGGENSTGRTDQK